MDLAERSVCSCVADHNFPEHTKNLVFHFHAQMNKINTFLSHYLDETCLCQVTEHAEQPMLLSIFSTRR